MEERWLDLPNHEGRFQVSNLGRVRSLRVLKQKPRSGCGYPVVTLQQGSSVYVHDLIARTFIGPKPAGRQVNHKDANKLNPACENLEYVTPKQNSEHAAALGLLKNRMRFTYGWKADRYAEKIIEMFFDEGRSMADCARRLSIDKKIVRSVVARWKTRNGTTRKNPFEWKLTFEKAEAIRAAYKLGNTTHRELADIFHVSSPHISRILSGQMWKKAR